MPERTKKGSFEKNRVSLVKKRKHRVDCSISYFLDKEVIRSPFLHDNGFILFFPVPQQEPPWNVGWSEFCIHSYIPLPYFLIAYPPPHSHLYSLGLRIKLADTLVVPVGQGGVQTLQARETFLPRTSEPNRVRELEKKRKKWSLDVSRSHERIGEVNLAASADGVPRGYSQPRPPIYGRILKFPFQEVFFSQFQSPRPFSLFFISSLVLSFFFPPILPPLSDSPTYLTFAKLPQAKNNNNEPFFDPPKIRNR